MPRMTTSSAKTRLARLAERVEEVRRRAVPPVLVITRYADDDEVAFGQYADAQRAELVVIVQKLAASDP